MAGYQQWEISWERWKTAEGAEEAKRLCWSSIGGQMEEGKEEVEMGYGGGFGVLRPVGCRVYSYSCGTEVSARGV